MKKKYDFSGWATRNDIKCSDGRTIRHNAFIDDDGREVPLVWNHQHNDPFNVLGHAILQNRGDGVYAYCKLNDTETGKNAKELIKSGDVKSLSIWANNLQQHGGDVLHGAIREVSLVLAGANPGAFIDSILIHGENGDESEEAIIYTGEDISLSDEKLDHSDSYGEVEENEDKTEENPKEEKMKNTNLEHADQRELTVEDVFNTLNEDQKTVVYALIGQALEDAGSTSEGDNGGEETMKHNVFDDTQEYNNEDVLSHGEMMEIVDDAKRYGSMKDSFLAHGIENIDYLFPDAKNVSNTPEWITRDMGWVDKVMNGVHHSAFSRIKSMAANITADEARAKGYIKGKLKKEEVFSLLKRTTDPQTVYKKQKMDRDDVIDITDFDVIAWLKAEMRVMLNEELARAFLVGDGRLASDDDKISEEHIRPIYNDAELYTVKIVVDVAQGATDDAKADAFITAAIKQRKQYKGSGNPTLYCTEDALADMLLLKDTTGRRIYENQSALATTIRVNEIVTVPVMDGIKDADNKPLWGIIVNLNDYNVGADKGGAVNMFDDFDIDYNQMKYLIETRCSGALVKPYSAMAMFMNEAAA